MNILLGRETDVRSHVKLRVAGEEGVIYQMPLTLEELSTPQMNLDIFIMY